MNKKGFLGDLLTYIVILFAMSIVIITFAITWDAINTGWQASNEIPQVSKDIINEQATRFTPIWDRWMIVAVIGYIIAIVITAISIRSHPVFAMIALLVEVILGIIAIYLSNAFTEFAGSTAIAPIANNFTRMSFVMERLPIFVVGLGIIFIIILYAKTRNQAVVL